MVKVCERHGALYADTVSYMDLDEVVGKMETDADFKQNMELAEGADPRAPRPFQLDEVRGEKSHKVSLYTLCCVCREKDRFNHMKKGHRKKDTTGIPVIHLPTGSDKDAPWEKYYVFQYDPTLKLQVMKGRDIARHYQGEVHHARS